MQFRVEREASAAFVVSTIRQSFQHMPEGIVTVDDTGSPNADAEWLGLVHDVSALFARWSAILLDEAAAFESGVRVLLAAGEAVAGAASLEPRRIEA